MQLSGFRYCRQSGRGHIGGLADLKGSTDGNLAVIKTREPENLNVLHLVAAKAQPRHDPERILQAKVLR